MFKRSEASEGRCLKCGWNMVQWHCRHMNSFVPKVLRILLVCVPDSGTAQHSLPSKVPKKWRKTLNTSAWAATSSYSLGAPGVLERDWLALQGWTFLFGQELPYSPPTHMWVFISSVTCTNGTSIEKSKVKLDPGNLSKDIAVARCSEKLDIFG